MTSDSQVLSSLSSGDLEGAVSTASRQQVSAFVSGCVKLATHKYVDAATQFFSAGKPEAAVAATLLDPWQHFSKLSSIENLPVDLADAVRKVTKEELLDAATAETVAAYIPQEAAQYVDVKRKMAEFNVFCVAKVAKIAQIATLERVVGAVGGFDTEELIGALIESDKLDAQIDQLHQTVQFSNVDENGRQTAHILGMFDRVEQLTSDYVRTTEA